MISVITPVYNGEKFVEFCIKVVIDQQCLDVEHIIVDGNSTDRTVEIIKKYADSYPHIRWISEQDKGQSDAMNKGIAMVRGEILAILNVDDYYEPNVLNRVLELFKELPVPSLLVGNCNIWEAKDKLAAVIKPANFNLSHILQGLNLNNFPANPSAYFYHTSLHQQVGLYKVDEHYAMDLDFLLRAVQVATVKYVDETWGNWMRTEGTKTVTLWQSFEQGQQLVDKILRTYRKDLPWLQRWRITIQYELDILWNRHLKWRPKYYLKTYLIQQKNILLALSYKLKNFVEIIRIKFSKYI
ncbi:MAG: glycosyltransferase [Fischerella sp.]|jgi:glycosyltransferase involved in cell wall biosynthesis|uniref:glycosyltransferase family 2 protein n=1 Tax=Fischerella sp. TaxID=1191 RepID=UPI0017A84FBE|nr:glycosyltransferase family 2 protein [Fischerella sp.]NWF60282.1 glycosyltransferase [Fischerella sp.]